MDALRAEIVERIRALTDEHTAAKGARRRLVCKFIVQYTCASTILTVLIVSIFETSSICSALAYTAILGIMYS